MGASKTRARGGEQAGGRRLEVRRVAIASLVPDPANARSHDERNVETVKGNRSANCIWLTSG
jgi:hypothetical protein